MKIGNYFHFRYYNGYHGDESIMILAQVEPFKVCLIDLKTGNRYNEPVLVEDVDDISKKEEYKIFYSDDDVGTTYFTPIEPPKFF